LRGHRGARGRSKQRAHIGHQGSHATIDQLRNLRQAAVQAVLRQGCELQKLVLRQGQRSANLRVVLVTLAVKRHQNIIGVVATQEKHTYQRFVARGRGRRLRKRIEGSEGAQSGQASSGGQRGVVNKATATDTHWYLPSAPACIDSS
jgi:hypothetical protein